MQIAHELRCTPDEAKKRVRSSMVRDYKKEFFRRENEANALHYYLAQIAYEMRASWVSQSDRMRLNVEKFLVKFIDPATAPQFTKEEYVQHATNVWRARLGIGTDGNVVTKKPPKRKNK